MGSYRKGLQLSLGNLIGLRVDLNAVAPSSTTPTGKWMCPEHKTSVVQKRWCREGDHEVATPLTGYDDGNTFRVVSSTSKPGFVADDSLRFLPVSRSELLAHTYHTGTMYYCSPSRADDKPLWALFVKLLQLKDVTLVAKGALRRGYQTMYQLDVWHDYLVLRGIQYPQHVRSIPERVEEKVSREDFTMLKEVAANLHVSWKDLDASDPNVDMIAEWISTGEAVERPDVRPAPANVVDLKSALQAAVEASS